MPEAFLTVRRHRRQRPAITRRTLLGSVAGGLAAGGAAPAAEPIATRLRIVVVGGHPGDPEYGCGGTIARYTDLGHEVTLLYLNHGEAPNSGPPGCTESNPEEGSVMRVREAIAACDILRAHAMFLAQCNGHAVVDRPHYDAFNLVLQALDPDVVFNQWPIDNHADHRAISNLTYEAWLHMEKRPALYYYEVSDGEDTQMFRPTDYVDITAAEPRKRAACYAHGSQTPDRYYALQAEVARFRGIEAGCSQAEAFVRHARSRGGLLP